MAGGGVGGTKGALECRAGVGGAVLLGALWHVSTVRCSKWYVAMPGPLESWWAGPHLLAGQLMQLGWTRGLERGRCCYTSHSVREAVSGARGDAWYLVGRCSRNG